MERIVLLLKFICFKLNILFSFHFFGLCFESFFDLLDSPKGRTRPATPQILYLLLPTGREVNIRVKMGTAL